MNLIDEVLPDDTRAIINPESGSTCKGVVLDHTGNVIGNVVSQFGDLDPVVLREMINVISTSRGHFHVTPLPMPQSITSYMAENGPTRSEAQIRAIFAPRNLSEGAMAEILKRKSLCASLCDPEVLDALEQYRSGVKSAYNKDVSPDIDKEQGGRS